MYLRIRENPSPDQKDQHKVLFFCLLPRVPKGNFCDASKSCALINLLYCLSDQCPYIIGNVWNLIKFISSHISSYNLNLPLNHKLKGVSSRAVFIYSPD